MRVRTLTRRAASYSSTQGSDRLEENGACALGQDALSAGATPYAGVEVYKDAVRYV